MAGGNRKKRNAVSREHLPTRRASKRQQGSGGSEKNKKKKSRHQEHAQQEQGSTKSKNTEYPLCSHFALWKAEATIKLASVVDLTSEASLQSCFPLQPGGGGLDIPLHIRAYSPRLEETFAKIQQFRFMNQAEQELEIAYANRICVGEQEHLWQRLKYLACQQVQCTAAYYGHLPHLGSFRPVSPSPSLEKEAVAVAALVSLSSGVDSASLCKEHDYITLHSDESTLGSKEEEDIVCEPVEEASTVSEDPTPLQELTDVEEPKKTVHEKRVAAWDEKYEQLLSFYNTHGHTKVPDNKSKFTKWVKNQRFRLGFKSRNEKDLSQTSLERIQKLERLSFFDGLPVPVTPTARESKAKAKAKAKGGSKKDPPGSKPRARRRSARKL